MENPKLTERLKLVASFVRNGKVLADIGTDHAYLPVWLVKKQIISKAYACDIHKGPLESAEKTIRLYGTADQIQTVLSNGLDEIKPEDVQDIVIAGMGGTLISEILSRAEWVKNPEIRLVLQPMTAVKELREYVYSAGFCIEKEEVAKEGSKVYIAMQAVYSGECREIDELFAIVGKIPETDSPYKSDYLTKQLNRLKKRINGLRISGLKPDELQKLEDTAEKIQKILE